MRNSDCRVVVEYVWGGPEGFLHGFTGEWQDEAGAKRDAVEIQRHSNPGTRIKIQRARIKYENVEFTVED